MINYLTTSEAATRLRLCQKTVRSWIKDGRISGVRVGPRMLIPESEVNRLLSSEQSSGPQNAIKQLQAMGVM